MHQSYLINIPDLDLAYISLTDLSESFKTNIHSHSTLELLLINKGSGEIITTNRRIQLNEGDMILINPNSDHCEVSSSMNFYALGIKNTNCYLKETFTKKLIKVGTKSKENFKQIQSCFASILNESISREKNFEEVIKNSYKTIELLLDRLVNISFNKDNSVQNLTKAYEIKNILDNFYYLEDLNLGEIAHRLSLSTSSICHLFKKEFNESIVSYKLNKQIKEAKNLLLENNMSIKQIASLVGINDESYFSKKFKEKVGLSPNEFRNSKK